MHNSANENVIDDLICKAIRARAFADTKYQYFSPHSTADILEIASSGSIVRSNVRGDELRSALRDDARETRREPRTRAIFIEGSEVEPERLPIESSMFEDIFDIYKISPRFLDFITRQHMPGRAVHHVAGSRELERHEIWYSAVIRTEGDYQGRILDGSRLVVNWQRMCVWSDYSTNGDATFVILRCPPHIKEKLYDAFQGDSGLSLRHNPMLLHAFLAEHLVMHAYDFLDCFSSPLYASEAKVNQLQSTEVYTERSKAFLALSRQIYQVSTDYDILAETITHLQKQSTWFNNEWLMSVSGSANSNEAQRMMDAQRVLSDAFDNLLKDVKLIRTYSNLYLERSKIGVSECFAMVNQRDAETNINIATESASTALASQQDNQSLRIIQILSMIFLPASLISSIFGMGFFNTQPREDGTAQFTVSSNWWWYVAISIPITIALWLFMMGYKYHTGEKIAKVIPTGRKMSGNSDLEANIEKKDT